VERFVRGYVRGAADFHAAFNARDRGRPVQGPAYRENLEIVARAVQQTPELVSVGLPYVDPEGRLDVGDIHNQIAFWQSLNLVGREVSGREIVDLSFVRGHTNVPRG
jgi:NitT/TauT family transport system substrate-binding protein